MSQPTFAEFYLSKDSQFLSSSASYSLTESGISQDKDLAIQAETSASHKTNLWGGSKAQFDTEQDAYLPERNVDPERLKRERFPMLDDEIAFIYKKIDEDVRGIKTIYRPTPQDREKLWAIDNVIRELVMNEPVLKEKATPIAAQHQSSRAAIPLIPIPTLPAHFDISVVEYVMHSLTVPHLSSAISGLPLSDYDPALVSDYDGYMKGSRKFFHRYPGSTLASHMYRDEGDLPFSFPFRSKFSWDTLLKRGRLLTDPVEVQEFFFGIKPLPTFDYTLFKKLPPEIRLKIVEEALEARTLELRFSENDDPSHPDFTQFDFRTTDPTPALVLANQAFREELTEGKYAPYELIFNHKSCKQKVYFNKKKDFVLFSRSSNCSQLREVLLKLAPLCLHNLRNISIAINLMDEGNMWLIKGFKNPNRVAGKLSALGSLRRHLEHLDDLLDGLVVEEKVPPLLSLFRRLDRVDFYSLAPKVHGDAWSQTHGGQCVRQQSSRFCFPPASNVIHFGVDCDCGDCPGPGPGTALAPVPHTLHAARKWARKFKVDDSQRVKEAHNYNKAKKLQFLEEQKQGLKPMDPPYLDEEPTNIPTITCKHAHITNLSGGIFCPWDGNGERTWERDDSNHCCWLDHSGIRD